MSERFFSKDISDEFIKNTIARMNNGEKLDDILENAEIQPGIYRKISKYAFHNKISQLKAINLPILNDYHPKSGRKPIEVDVQSSIVYSNLKDFQKGIGINAMTQKIRSDLQFVSEHQQNFSELKQKLDENPNLTIKNIMNSENFTDSIDRITERSHIPQTTTTSIQISEINYRLPTCLYLDPSIPPPSYNMGRKIYDALLKDEQSVQELPQLEKNYHKYQAAFVYQIFHADIHYMHHKRRHYLYAIIDDKSRFIIEYQVMSQKSALNCWNVFDRAIQKIHCQPFAIWTDNGKENLGIFEKNCRERNIQQIFSLPATPRLMEK